MKSASCTVRPVEQQVQHPSTLAFELLAGVPDVVGDPHSRYRALREQAPDPPRWRRSMTLRGLDELNVRLTA